MDYSIKRPNHLKIIRGDKEVLKAIFNIRLQEKQCLKCGAPDSKIHLLKERKALICGVCLQHYYPLAGTVMEHTHFPEADWWDLMIRFCVNPISANEVTYFYGCSYSTGLSVLDRIRQLMKNAVDQLKFSGEIPIEIDEAGQLTGNKGMGRHYHFKHGRGSRRHSTILLLVERGGGIAKLFKIHTQGAESIIPIILQEVPKGTKIYTDEWSAYNQLTKLGYEHKAVIHGEYQFVHESGSTNTCENFFSNYKRKISGTYTSISDHKMDLYNAEFCFRYTYKSEVDRGFQKLLNALPALSEHYKFAA